MPRGKSAPRKRPLEDDEPASIQPASLPDDLPELVEKAEIDAVRRRMGSGDAAEILVELSDAVPVRGLARIDLDVDDMRVLNELHTTILKRLDDGRLAGWGGVGDHSGRQRGYGYLPGLRLAESHYKEGSITMREYTGAEAEADACANRNACVMLDETDLPDGLNDALANVTRTLGAALPPEYASILQPAHLVAAQPNLHRGRAYLRPHLDEPLHDGFGIVIVTVAVRGDASILLTSRPWDAACREEYFFGLRQGQAYALASDARNICLHGVLADTPERESLNLRFGLHAASKEGPFSAWEEVERHWPAPAPAAR